LRQNWTNTQYTLSFFFVGFKQQFFEVVSVSEIRAAQYQLTSELEPQIKQLVKQTENGLVKLQKREQMLRTNVCVCVCVFFFFFPSHSPFSPPIKRNTHV
jgi:hypothetical protein